MDNGTITFYCECGKDFTVNKKLAGKRGTCKSCGRKFVIPKPNISLKSSKTDKSSRSKLKSSKHGANEQYVVIASVLIIVLAVYLLTPPENTHTEINTEQENNASAPEAAGNPPRQLERNEVSKEDAKRALEAYFEACRVSNKTEVMRLSLLDSYEFIDNSEILGFHNVKIDVQDLKAIIKADQWIEKNMRVEFSANMECKLMLRKDDVALKRLTAEMEEKKNVVLEKYADKAAAENLSVDEYLAKGYLSSTTNKDRLIFDINSVKLKFLEEKDKLLYTQKEAYKKAGLDITKFPFLEWMIENPLKSNSLLEKSSLTLSKPCKYRFETIDAICNMAILTKKGITKKHRYEVKMLRLIIDNKDSGWQIEAIDEMN